MRVDVLVLCETWFTADNVIDIPGYTCVHCCRVNRVGGGVSIYVINDLKCLVKEVCNHSDNIVEILWVKLTSVCDGALYTYAVYRPPSHENIPEFNAFMENVLQEHRPSDQVVVCGDVNIDTLDPDNAGNLFIELMHSFSFFPCISLPTM